MYNAIVDAKKPLPKKWKPDSNFGKRHPKKKLIWTNTCADAFAASKRALADATMLHHPVPGAKIALTTDASDVPFEFLIDAQAQISTQV